MRELLQGLPVRLATWLLNPSKLKRLASVLLLLFLGNALGGIVEGEGFDFWRINIRPWFGSAYTDWPVTNGFLVAFIVGWVLVILFAISGILIYGADRRRLGQLEIVGNENAEREKTIINLNEKLTEQGAELETASTTIQTLKGQVDTLAKQSKALFALSQIDRELFIILHSNGELNDDSEDNFIYSVVRRIFEIFDNDIYRSCMYVPDPEDPDYLVIAWDHGVGEASRRWNRWYIGTLDPGAIHQHRGIAGNVYLEETSRVCKNVRDDPDFYDPYTPPRINLPYQSSLNILIHPEDKRNKIGVLCIDSSKYIFDSTDRDLVEAIVTRIGWFIFHRRNSVGRSLAEGGGDD